MKSLEDMVRFMAEAAEQGRVGLARKVAPVEARPARPGEVVVTVIEGEGEETRSRPAKEGDWVVRARHPARGHEEYLVGAEKFSRRYEPTGGAANAGGWRDFTPRAGPRRFVTVRPEDGTFAFEAPWGEPMVARPGDAILQDPEDETDVYRVEGESFRTTYQVVDE